MSNRFLQEHILRVLGLAAFLLLTGCMPALPSYEWNGADATLETITRRHAEVDTLASDCIIQLGSPDGETIVLDGVLYSRAPDQLRMAGWKFSERVFDLLVSGGRSWIHLSSKVEERAGSDADLEALDADRFASMWRRATGAIDPEQVVSIDDHDTDNLEVTVDGDVPGVELVYRIDRSTRTVREIRIMGDGVLTYRLLLSGHRAISDIVWPTRISGTGAHGSFSVRMSDIEFNSVLPRTTFKPTSRMRMHSE